MSQIETTAAQSERVVEEVPLSIFIHLLSVVLRSFVVSISRRLEAAVLTRM